MKYICRECENEPPCICEVQDDIESPFGCLYGFREDEQNADWKELKDSDYFEMRGIGKTQTEEKKQKTDICDKCRNNDETCSLCNDCKNESMFEKKSKDRFVQDRLFYDRPAATPEPEPTGNGKYVLFEVIKDLCARADAGQKKYGTMLRTENGRDALNDAIQEAIDLVMYLKQAAMEREA